MALLLKSACIGSAAVQPATLGTLASCGMVATLWALLPGGLAPHRSLTQQRASLASSQLSLSAAALASVSGAHTPREVAGRLPTDVPPEPNRRALARSDVAKRVTPLCFGIGMVPGSCRLPCVWPCAMSPKLFSLSRAPALVLVCLQLECAASLLRAAVLS
eukprot:126355-Chlamydomonas_euryale.AAC.7